MCLNSGSGDGEISLDHLGGSNSSLRRGGRGSESGAAPREAEAEPCAAKMEGGPRARDCRWSLGREGLGSGSPLEPRKEHRP